LGYGVATSSHGSQEQFQGAIEDEPFRGAVRTDDEAPVGVLATGGELQTTTAAEMKRRKEKIDRLRDEAASKAEVRYNEGRKEAEFKGGQKVWLKDNERENSLAPKRLGPFEIEEIVSALDVKLRRTAGGPSLGRRTPTVNVKQVVEYENPNFAGAKEHRVRDIIGHKGKGNTRRYQVVWEDGDETWEPREQLVDEVGGEEVLNEALERYYQRNPRLGRAKGNRRE